MRFLIEVVADSVEDAVPLIREVATRLKGGKGGRIKSGETTNHCIGDYRVIIHEDEGAWAGWRCNGFGGSGDGCDWIDRSSHTERSVGDPCPQCGKPIVEFHEMTPAGVTTESESWPGRPGPGGP